MRPAAHALIYKPYLIAAPYFDARIHASHSWPCYVIVLLQPSVINALDVNAPYVNALDVTAQLVGGYL